MRAWAAAYYPHLPAEVVAGAVQRLRAARAEITPDAVRRMAYRIDPTMEEDPLAPVHPLPERAA